MLKRISSALLAVMLAVAPALAQVSVPNTLVSGAVIKASDLNTNFSTLGNHALDRLSGGNISGNVTADPGVTIDGIDLSVALCAACAATFKDLTLSSPTTGLTVAGINVITSTAGIPVANLTGTIATARLGSGAADATKFLQGDSSWQTTPCLPTVTAKSTTYTAALCDFVEGTGTFTVTLPAASTAIAGKKNIIDVKNVSTGVITVARAGSDTIDGATSYTLSVQNQSITLIANASGTGWDIR